MNNHIHWYPGHIAKAERELKEKLKQVDLILEIYDERIPYSGAYQTEDKLTNNKTTIILMNKSDLADDIKTKFWIKKIRNKLSGPCILTTTQNQKDTKIIRHRILDQSKPLFEKLKSKGLLERPVRFMVIGMPNV